MSKVSELVREALNIESNIWQELDEPQANFNIFSQAKLISQILSIKKNHNFDWLNTFRHCFLL